MVCLEVKLTKSLMAIIGGIPISRNNGKSPMVSTSSYAGEIKEGVLWFRYGSSSKKRGIGNIIWK